MFRRTSASLFLALFFLVPILAATSEPCTVTYVADGDTITCQCDGKAIRVRLAGIDAPKRGFQGRPGQPFTEKARMYVESLVVDTQVRVKRLAKYRLDRVLGTVYLNGHEVNPGMIRQGYAEAYRGENVSGLRSHWDAEAEAQAKKLNIWSQGNYVSPREWRRSNP
jgi:micrococcal nuclease